MKKLFLTIRKNNLEAVEAMLAKNPDLVHAVAKAPPKKDDGQSPLQVALKTGNFEIAQLLLDKGADVQFIESEACCNPWRAPVLHYAIRTAVLSSRWNTQSSISGFTLYNSAEKADTAFTLLANMLELGADVNAQDSYGNSGLDRACFDARQVLPTYNHATATLGTERVFTDELRSDLSRIFDILFEYGADLSYVSPNVSYPVAQQYLNEPVSEFFPSSSMASKK